MDLFESVNNKTLVEINLMTLVKSDFIVLVEILLILISIVVATLVIFTVNASGLLHFHFLSLIQCAFVFFLFCMLCRLIIAIGIVCHIKNSNIEELYLLYSPAILTKVGLFGYIQIARYSFGAIAAFILLFMLFERTLATIKYKTYENYKSRSLIVFSTLFSMIVASSLTVLYCTGIISNILYLAIPCLFMGGLGISMLTGSYFYNIYKYKQSLQYHSYFTLSHKYQLLENVRLISLLWKACFVGIFNIFLASIVFIGVEYFDSYSIKHVCFILFNYIVASYMIVLLTIVISTTPIWKKLFFDTIKTLKIKLIRRKPLVADANIAQERLRNLTTFHGQQMVFTNEQQCDLYFQQLRNDWSRNLPTQRM